MQLFKVCIYGEDHAFSVWIWTFFIVQNAYCAPQVRLPKPPAKPAQQKGKKPQGEEPANQNQLSVGVTGTQLLEEGKPSTRSRRRPQAELQQVRIWVCSSTLLSLLLAPCSSHGVGEEEQGWKRATGSVTDSRSWQMLAGFQYSKEEPDCHRFQPRAWVPGGQCLTCPKPGTSKCWIRTWATLNSLNSFQHTQLLSGPQWAPLPRPSLKPEQQKEDMGQEDHSSYLSRPQTRGTRRQFHVEEKPLQFDTTWQEPEHPKKVRGSVLPYNSHSALRRKDQLF